MSIGAMQNHPVGLPGGSCLPPVLAGLQSALPGSSAYYLQPFVDRIHDNRVSVETTQRTIQTKSKCSGRGAVQSPIPEHFSEL